MQTPDGKGNEFGVFRCVIKPARLACRNFLNWNSSSDILDPSGRGEWVWTHTFLSMLTDELTLYCLYVNVLCSRVYRAYANVVQPEVILHYKV